MTILDEIVARTKSNLRARKAEVSIRELEDSPEFDGARHDLTAALSGSGLSVIAEIKKASPSKGLIRDDMDVVGIASSYEENGAAAISVLTETDFFLGSLDNLRATRRATTTPLLRKDFILDPYQVVEARAWGADAILLIAACLDREQLNELLHTAMELGVGHLVEIHDERELDKVDMDMIEVLGVNNRDLTTFEVDLDRSGRVFRLVPAGIIRVTESGITGPEDIDAVVDAGADALLIGEALMRAEDPGGALAAIVEAGRTAMTMHQKAGRA